MFLKINMLKIDPRTSELWSYFAFYKLLNCLGTNRAKIEINYIMP